MKNILFVLTSNDKMGDTGKKTGFWVEEFAAPYYKLIDAGYEVTLASPEGGQPPIDPMSDSEDAATEATKRFDKDEKTKEKLAHTLKLNTIDQKGFDAVFYPGGHGLMWDLVEDPTSIGLIESFYKHEKPIAFVCHAPAVLKHVKNVMGEPLVKGRKVAGFTNEEEEGVELTDVVPFLVEEMLKENGGKYSKGSDWEPYAVEDGLLITGQNPASSEKVAEILMKKLQ
ncbi:type 1 glutamine amidotransferase domain-containing protein [Zeaxanthinibacter enoshimensis]|uniref:Putative intracellular protease/amidase n=1 Tax=Zeaxanthinibacter enoshimensis TaxID=392009 RepID=A0A4R6TP28_9FLAO|nr:type 1 glutamine amidotransferase domain-containing protein [Zeaxanthinibacter enoshimensis]TDQ31111.1 putative intracellular protease/amidase [Zeaxanthinibacter enoshimensis]